MKKSMLNVITLALVLINLVLTVVLTFSLVSTNNKTNKLITKVAEIIELDVGGLNPDGSLADGKVNVDDIQYVDVMNGDSDDITVSYSSGGKTHYVVLKVTIGLNTKADDYATKSVSVNNGMRLIVSTVTNEAIKYNYDAVQANKQTIEKALLESLQQQFQTKMICSVTISEVLVQ
ncbi:MAG: flagellar basal body-associated FliL family protein [Lachnospira sp.]|nr:flagellar basal body-associated FliL family protein [Lachnospira sp.]